MAKVIGIDLGTTFSVVATCDENGTPHVVRNALDAETTPSVVRFDGVGSASAPSRLAKAAVGATHDLTVTVGVMVVVPVVMVVVSVTTAVVGMVTGCAKGNISLASQGLF